MSRCVEALCYSLGTFPPPVRRVMTSASEATGRVKWDPGPITVNSVTCTERQGNSVQSGNCLASAQQRSLIYTAGAPRSRRRSGPTGLLGMRLASGSQSSRVQTVVSTTMCVWFRWLSASAGTQCKPLLPHHRSTNILHSLAQGRVAWSLPGHRI